ncbi:MAG TPA: hypothetical protein K8U78_05780 [Aeriscardovia aeriphila]|uniref:N-acetyltransferase domain-containing protein n=1 Tax=Aeriscardovia aeriphila TaxID=218139 RepID=A0A921FVZ5_9BIFI|nr:hypothetical protein [Aeriscardovia aeriphila]
MPGMNKVTMRRIMPQDIPWIISLDQRTWYPHEEGDAPEAAQLEATLEVEALLTGITWSCVVEVNDKPAGIAVGTINSEKDAVDPAIQAELTRLGDEAREQLARLKPQAIRFHAADIAEDEKLEKHAKATTDAELRLFMMEPEARGYHLGSRTFNQWLTALRQAQAKTYFLFTDSSCSVGFYDHRGLTRVASMKSAIYPELEKYIYVGMANEAD